VPLRVGIIGDSAMWGQGLSRERTFAFLAASRIAAAKGQDLDIVPGRGIEPLRGEARSGAKLEAVPEIIRPSPQPGEPNAVGFRAGDHSAFELTFPRLFLTEAERALFRDGRDETPATRLFGEHPATFPTVTEAIQRLAGLDGSPVQLVIMDGGINDLDFEDVLDPDGPDIKRINEQIQGIFGARLDRALRSARRAFPTAVIVVTGYFPALTNQSDHDELATLFKYFAGKPEWMIALNDFVQYVPVISDLLNAVGLGKDVDEAVDVAVSRTITAAAHAHFWTRRTIASLPGAVLRPGLVYAHPSFAPENGLFAGARSLLHEGYRLPGEGRHSVGDEMLETRVRNMPRHGLLTTFRAVAALGTVWLVLRGAQERSALLDRLRPLLREEDLPVQLRFFGQQVLESDDVDTYEKFSAALQRDIGRIEVATIASFLHPNEQGARRYADRIVAAYDAADRFPLRRTLRPMGTGGNRVSVAAAIKRHGFDPKKGLRRLVPFASIQSVAVQLRGLDVDLQNSLVNSLAPLLLELRLNEQLAFNVKIPFPSPSNLFRAFDALDVPLAKVERLTLRLRGPGTLDLTSIAIFLNGRDFLAVDEPIGFGFGETIDLQLSRRRQ
jgi:hypothetical protein